MDANQDYYSNLPDRINATFPEIDDDIVTELRKVDEGYAALFWESSRLQTDFPIIMDVLEGNGEISLTSAEHTALVQYLVIKQDMGYAERRHIYFRGHTDNYAYLKKINSV